MKTIVINTRDSEKSPFLRGILIRSLLDAGLPFEDAYEMATRVRTDISDMKTISTEELELHVSGLLEKMGDEKVLEQYTVPSVIPARIIVTDSSGVHRPFSRAQKVKYLRSAGVKEEKAELLTEQIFAELVAAGVTEITTMELGYITYLCLQQEVGKKTAKRYLVWSEFQDSGRPLVLLIGGTVAAGKSTIATEIAHLLEIVRIQSTDMLREVMRMMTPRRLLPILHTSSFMAWKALPTQDKAERDFDQLVADGYRSQAGLLAVPCEAVLQRAVEESVSIILEGVHVQPDLLKRAPSDSGVITVYVMLAVLKSKKIKSRLRGRGLDAPNRNSERHLDNLDSIWSLQSHLLSEADRHDVPIITSGDRETAILQVTQQVNGELAKHFSGSVSQVFGSVVDRLDHACDDCTWKEKVALLKALSD